jgi:NADH dehydrogenase
MLLLTGASGTVGTALLRRLIAQGMPVRCLVRDPKELGADRVRVQIALGDLADPPSFRNAMRGVDTVIHLAGSPRDQADGSIEELNGIATWRMVGAAERAGVERFVYLSAMGAATFSRTRLHRAKALAERAVLDSSLRATVLAPSLVYAPDDRWLTALGRFALLPAVPMPGRGRALFQPIWADDVADCVMAVLHGAPGGRYELAGPETLSHEDIVHLALRSYGRSRPLVRIPTPVVSRGLKLMEAALQSSSPAVWDEAELLEVSMITSRGAADAGELGVRPRAMGEVLGAT